MASSILFVTVSVPGENVCMKRTPIVGLVMCGSVKTVQGVVGEQVDRAVEKAPSAPRLWKPLALCISVQVICYVQRSNLAMRVGMCFWALCSSSLSFKPAPQFLFSPFFRVGWGFLFFMPVDRLLACCQICNISVTFVLGSSNFFSRLTWMISVGEILSNYEEILLSAPLYLFQVLCT